VRATTRPVTIELDREGRHLLATAASEHASVAVYADTAATAAELAALLGDLRIDVPVQGRRIGVFESINETLDAPDETPDAREATPDNCEETSEESPAEHAATEAADD